MSGDGLGTRWARARRPCSGEPPLAPSPRLMSSVFEHTELLLPVLAFAVPVLLVAMFTSLISSDAPKKKFPVHKRS